MKDLKTASEEYSQGSYSHEREIIRKDAFLSGAKFVLDQASERDNDFLEKVDWAINTIRDQVLFGRDELGAAKSRELRAKGVLLDVRKHVIDTNIQLQKLQDDRKELIEVITDLFLEDDHLPECKFNNYGYEYDCKCMDRNFFNRDSIMERMKALIEKLKAEKL